MLILDFYNSIMNNIYKSYLRDYHITNTTEAVHYPHFDTEIHISSSKSNSQMGTLPPGGKMFK